jgi:N-alpha-acetyltransferase 35, NatC auxiliary subunit
MEVLGSMSIRQMLDDDFSIVVLPASLHLDRANDEIEAVHDPRFTIAQQMEIFRQRAAQPYLDILRTFCQNRCRVRRTLYHVTRAWDNLQLDAEEIDQIIQTKTKERPVPYQSTMSREPVDSYSLPLSSWAYFYKLKQMEWIVQLGFELEVYQADELAGMYWYLNYLAKCRLQHTERIRFFIMQRVTEFRSRPRSLDFEEETQLHRALSFVRLSLLNAAVTWELSDAMSCLYTVLNRLQLVKQLPRPYSNDELRYDIRMKPFSSIGLPELPTFEEFTTATTQAETSVLDILEYAEKALAGAKKGIEVMSKFSAEESFSVGSHDRWTTSVKNWLKSSIAAGLAITTLQKAVQKAGENGNLKLKAEVPTPDRAYHEWWIAPKLVPIT